MTNLFPAFIIIAIVAVIMLTELIKKLDKKDVLKGYRVWVPAILSFVLAAFLRVGNFFSSPDQVWFWWTVIFSVSIFAYEAILKKLSMALEK